MMQKINITYVLCKIGGYQQYCWVADALDKERFNLSFIFLDATTNTLKEILTSKGFTCYQLDVKSKKDIPKAIYQTIQILKKEKTAVVHTHLVEASLIGLMAAKFLGIKKRIYTRHHADFHHLHYKKGVYIDNFINYLSTDIIAISKNVQQVIKTKEKFHQNKILLIYHGFDLTVFNQISSEDIALMQSKYNLHTSPVIGMVSRYETGKGIVYAIKAFEYLLKEYPNAILVIANAFGSDAEIIKQQLQKLPTSSYREIEYEHKINALYKCFDMLVHVPINPTYEAFGQVYIEAMAAGIPCVCTLSGIAVEYIENGKNAIVVDYENAEEIYEGMKIYINNSIFKQTIISTAKNDVQAIFGFDKMMSALNNLYLS